MTIGEIWGQSTFSFKIHVIIICKRDYSKVKGNLLFQQAAVSCSLPFTFMFLLVIFSCFAISAVVSSLPFLQVMISYFVLVKAMVFALPF